MKIIAYLRQIIERGNSHIKDSSTVTQRLINITSMKSKSHGDKGVYDYQRSLLKTDVTLNSEESKSVPVGRVLH